jgi:cation:H+ antiporter
MVTSVSAITIVQSPDLAAGNIFGSIVMNIMFIALIDLLQGRGSLLYTIKRSHILYGGLGIVAMAVTTFSILLRQELPGNLGLFNFGLDSLILIIIYAIGLKLIFGQDKKIRLEEKDPLKPSSRYSGIRLSSAITLFSLCFAVIVFLGLWLASIGEEIVITMNWNEALVGTIFLALATSLPELVVSISSFKFAADMAVGNILGANFLDIMVVPVSDIFFRQGEFLSYVTSKHTVTLMLGIILTSIVVVGLIYRSRRSFLKLGWDALAMLATFIVGGYFVILIMKG